MSYDINWGDVPTWITTAAIGLAVLSVLLERKSNAAEEDRNAKSQATKLSTWVVSQPKSTPGILGVVISNSSESTFHDVEIHARFFGMNWDEPIILNVLPPGKYFAQFRRRKVTGHRAGWAFPIEVTSEPMLFQPYMNTADYGVNGMRFTDNLDQTWLTNEHAVLSRERKNEPAMSFKRSETAATQDAQAAPAEESLDPDVLVPAEAWTAQTTSMARPGSPLYRERPRLLTRSPPNISSL